MQTGRLSTRTQRSPPDGSPDSGSQAKANILVELLIMGARYMVSSPMGDDIVV